MSEQQPNSHENPRDYSVPEFLDIYRENPIGTPETWGAVPFLSSAEVQEQQNDVHAHVAELFLPENIPDYIPPNLASYIEHTHLARVQHRESKNIESYTLRGNFDFQVPSFDTFDVHFRGQNGKASPAELIYLQQYLQMPSIELASLTHPYAQKLYPNITEMRQATLQAIEMHNGVVFDEHAVKNHRTIYEVKGIDRVDDTSRAEGLHMTRKRMLGTLPDESLIVERSSFVIRLDALPEKYSSAIRSIPYMNNEHWARQVLRRAEKFYEVVPDLLEWDQYEVAVPLSTTIVSMNGERIRALTSEEAMRARNNLILNRADAPKPSLF